MKAIHFAYVLSFLSSSSALLKSIKLDEIRYDNLMEKLTTNKIKNLLSTVGIFKISDIPNFEIAQKDAFETLSSCLLGHFEKDRISDDNIFETFMEDGTKRLSIGTKSHNELSQECGRSASNLRSIVDKTTQLLFNSLDLSLNSKNSNYVMKPYTLFEDLMKSGEHLEHLHAFYNTKKISPKYNANINKISPTSSFSDDNLALKMHTDMGLLIAMTTGYYSSTRVTNVVCLLLYLQEKSFISTKVI